MDGLDESGFCDIHAFHGLVVQQEGQRPLPEQALARPQSPPQLPSVAWPGPFYQPSKTDSVTSQQYLALPPQSPTPRQ